MPGTTAPRALLRIGGQSVLRQQLRVAQVLECDRIVCLGSGITPKLLELQHLAEKGGASFHLIADPRALGGLVTATDEVISIEDGLLAVPGELAALLTAGQGVLVQPIEQGLEAGFERIDLNHAGAGAMRLPGRLVERLAELPPDCDAHSALQRIALQAGVVQRPIPAAGQRSPVWALIRQEADATALEPLWIRLRTRQDVPLGPSRWLALAGVRHFGPALLHAGSNSVVLVIGALLVALLGLGSGWFGLIPLGLGFCALGWALRQAAAMLSRIENDEASGLANWLQSGGMSGWLADALLVTLTGWGAGGVMPLHERFFPPLILVALLRLLPRVLGPGWTAWLEDRALVALVLAIAVATGFARETVEGAAAVLALTGILLPGRDFRLTRP